MKKRRVKTGPCVVCRVEDELNHYGVCESCRAEARQVRMSALRKRVHELNGDTGSPGRFEVLASEFSFREIADFYGKHITPADVYRMTKGIEPADREKRRAFGLPEYKPTPVCPDCGVVHVADCPERVPVRKRTRKPERDAEWLATVQEIVDWANGAEWTGRKYKRMRSKYRK